MDKRWTTDEVDSSPSFDDQATIALLQEEVARLEDEILRRAEADSGAPAASTTDERVSEEATGRRLADLAAELAARDETITWLMEQVRLFEEAESAGRAELEQLHQWVEQVERRVEGREDRDRDLEVDLASARREADALRREIVTERRAWEVRRLASERDVEHLRESLADLARRPDSGAALDALEQENIRLRQAIHEMSQATTSAAEVDSLRRELQSTHADLDEAAQQLRRALDDRERERQEHDAALAIFRGQRAREALNRPAEGLDALPTTGPKEGLGLTPDQRIRAFRQHLKEIHEREEQERKGNRLSARLSRLWRHTGPNR